MPVIGYLSARTPADLVEVLADFRRGLAETGFVEGRNVAIEYRWPEGMIGFKKWSPIWFGVRSP